MLSSRFSTITFVVFLLLSLILVVHLLFRFINPVIMAVVIVSIFNPFYRWLLAICKRRDYLAAGIATIVVFLGVMIPVSLFILALGQQAVMLFQATERLTSSTDIGNWTTSLRHHLDQLNKYLAGFNISISIDQILNFTATLSQDLGEWIYKSIGSIATNLLSLVFNFLLAVALVFVFFISGQDAKLFLMKLIPMPAHEKEIVVKRFAQLAKAVFVGNGLISAMEGILGSFSFLVCQIPGALIFGVFMTITSFLPVIGAFVIVLPAAVYLFLIGKQWWAITFLVFNTVQLTFCEALIKPKLIGTKSQMHAVLVFMSVLAGIQVYGTLGIFYGPLLVTIFLSLAEIYKEHYRERLLKS